MSDEQIPHSPPGPEAVRLAHLGQESSIKSVGQLCYLVAFFSFLGTIEFTVFALGIIPTDDLKAEMDGTFLTIFFWVVAVLFSVNSVAQIVLGRGLIKLQAWARWTVAVLTIFSLGFGILSSLSLCLSGSFLKELEPLIGFRINGLAVGLISLLVGSAIHLLILWALVRPGSGVVFSRDYREIIRQTPRIRSRMHWLLKTLIALILLGCLGIVGYLFALSRGLID